MKERSLVRVILVWSILTTVVAVPIAAAAASPQLEWRDPVYIAAGFAGVIAMALMLVQPLLAGDHLLGLHAPRRRRLHKVIGSVLVAAVVAHVAALWITSPPDAIDALLFLSPTAFSVWGVTAMWAVFASALVAAFRQRLRLRPQVWRFIHAGFAAVTAVGGVVHALLIDGTMETVTKAVLCALVLAATMKVTVDLWSRAARAGRNRRF